MRFRLIGCEVLERELRMESAQTPHPVDLEILPKALHDLGGKRMRARIQERIDAVEPERYSAILLGYARCGNGLAGIEARRIPVVIPRSHDCIAMLLGSRPAYDAIVEENAGTYFRSPGWVEHCPNTMQLSGAPADVTNELDWLMEKYGQEPGRYLYEELYRYQRTYSRLVYIDTGAAPDGRFEREARREAEKNDWRFEKHPGNRLWFRKLITGNWDEDFLILQPGERSVGSHDSSIFRTEEIPV
ncbi:MAG: DUF1638 domain-containing protein [Bryobacterales bacterium]|nr:DUF1638 domain-containing protein [Bryobacterales bacterium]